MVSSAESKAKPTLVLCADFDQTITTRDTIALLFSAANATRDEGNEREAHARSVRELVAKYMADYNSVLASVLNDDDGAVHLTEETSGGHFDEEGLERFLDAFAEADLRSIARVQDSKTLQGLQHSDFVAIGDSVNIMDGCVQALAMGTRVCVVSSNWSRTMIGEKLGGAGLDSVNIVANELITDEHGITTGDIDLVVQSPSDKAASLIKQASTDSKDTLVFIGDSINDVLAMLYADVGIALSLSSESTFDRVCRRFGITLIPFSHRHFTLEQCTRLVKNAKSSHKRVVFFASSWDEIRTVLAADRRTEEMMR